MVWPRWRWRSSSSARSTPLSMTQTDTPAPVARGSCSRRSGVSRAKISSKTSLGVPFTFRPLMVAPLAEAVEDSRRRWLFELASHALSQRLRHGFAGTQRCRDGVEQQLVRLPLGQCLPQQIGAKDCCCLQQLLVVGSEIAVEQLNHGLD